MSTVARVCVLAAVALAAAAGAHARAAWTVGIKGGPCMATLRGDDAGGAGTRTSFGGGAFAEGEFSENVSLRVEGLFLGKGASFHDADQDEELSLDYFEIPILFVLQLPVSLETTLSAFAGPAIGLNMGAEYESTFGTSTVTEDVDDQFSNVDLGLVLGAGVNVAVRSIVIGLDARFDLGLTGVGEDDLPGQEQQVKNRAWLVMASLGFPVSQ
ncbi:MAG TPA: porin family protein [Candidatus Krumholzibacteria bacterium]|nr:porin family protein [Candidatus Krumholzibacteria bacterium]